MLSTLTTVIAPAIAALIGPPLMTLRYHTGPVWARVPVAGAIRAVFLYGLAAYPWFVGVFSLYWVYMWYTTYSRGRWLNGGEVEWRQFGYAAGFGSITAILTGGVIWEGVINANWQQGFVASFILVTLVSLSVRGRVIERGALYLIRLNEAVMGLLARARQANRPKMSLTSSLQKKDTRNVADTMDNPITRLREYDIEVIRKQDGGPEFPPEANIPLSDPEQIFEQTFHPSDELPASQDTGSQSLPPDHQNSDEVSTEEPDSNGSPEAVSEQEHDSADSDNSDSEESVTQDNTPGSDVPDLPDEYQQEVEEHEDESPVPLENAEYENIDIDHVEFTLDISVSFEDIGGYTELLEDIRDGVVRPLIGNSEKYERFDIEPPQGMLLYGPPGTGKTLLGKAIADAVGRPFAQVNTAKMTSKYINETPRLIEAILKKAHEKEGVLLIDEAEQLVGDRGDEETTSHAEDAKAVSTMLNVLQMDGTDFFVILTTNRKEDIDDAIIRPGRIGKHYEVGLPDAEDRHEILWTHIKNTDAPHSLRNEDVAEVAFNTDGATGADLEEYYRSARLNAIDADAGAVRLEHFPDHCLGESPEA